MKQRCNHRSYADALLMHRTLFSGSLMGDTARLQLFLCFLEFPAKGWGVADVHAEMDALDAVTRGWTL